MGPISRMPMSSTDKLRSELIFKSQAGQLSARFVVIPEFRITEHLPCRLGEDPALDDAVRLICCSNLAETLHSYGRALRSLQSTIERGPSSEALGAATLLHMHDLSRHAPYKTWAVHAKGVIDMLKVRGPHSIKTGFDKCLLQAQVGNITFDALRERRPCFLSLPEWNSKVKSLSQLDEVSYSWEMSLIAIGVRVPGLICQFEALANERGDGQGDERAGFTDTSSLYNELHHVRQEIDDALASVPAESAGTNRIRPALLLSANTYLLMIDYMLDDVEAESGLSPGTGGGAGLSRHPERISDVFTLDTTKALYQRLYGTDAVALQTTAKMLKLTLDRVLDAADDARTKTAPMAMVLNELYQMLSSPPQVHRNGQCDREQDHRVGASGLETVILPP